MEAQSEMNRGGGGLRANRISLNLNKHLGLDVFINITSIYREGEGERETLTARGSGFGPLRRNRVE